MALNAKKGNDIKSITAIYYKLKTGTTVVINNIYKGTRLIWTSIKNALSAFGSGIWRNDLPWKNEDYWKNE